MTTNNTAILHVCIILTTVEAVRRRVVQDRHNVRLFAALLETFRNVVNWTLHSIRTGRVVIADEVGLRVWGTGERGSW